MLTLSGISLELVMLLPKPQDYQYQSFYQLLYITVIFTLAGSSSHPIVVFREVLHLIELEFRDVGFRGEGKTAKPREKPL